MTTAQESPGSHGRGWFLARGWHLLYAFEELNGADLRREPIEVRKATLASILRKARHGVRLNEHLEHDCGLTVFQHACRMGWKGSCPSAWDRAIVWPIAGRDQVQEPGSARR
jgi:hypothetical protein